MPTEPPSPKDADANTASMAEEAKQHRGKERVARRSYITVALSQNGYGLAAAGSGVVPERDRHRLECADHQPRRPRERPEGRMGPGDMLLGPWGNFGNVVRVRTDQAGGVLTEQVVQKGSMVATKGSGERGAALPHTCALGEGVPIAPPKVWPSWGNNGFRIKELG